MANVSFNKLGLKKKDEVKTIKINEQEVEIKQYLPIQDKLNVMFNAISKAEDNNRFFNPIKLECYCTLEIIYAYTNLKFTEAQLKDEGKIYDLLEENKIIDMIFEQIPEEESNYILNSCERAAEAIYTYNNSVLGVLENLKNNSGDLTNQLNEALQMINNPEALTYIKKLIEMDAPIEDGQN